jgi:hypothetical protein
MNVILNNEQMRAARLLSNSSNPFSSTTRSSWWGGTFSGGTNSKHNLFYDFGYPAYGELVFEHFYNMHRRNGIAKALIEKTASKTWQSIPKLLEMEEAHEETSLEADVRQWFSDIRLWQNLQETDRRSMVGKYAGLIFQLADGQPYREPVEGQIAGGLEGLISVLPAWEGQLEPSSWDMVPTSPTYGMPSMFRFNESSVDPENGKIRSFEVHPDRCFIWSKDGTTWGESKLEPCYNAMMDMEKIRGAGGEGFWKNAKSQPILSASPEVDFNQLAAMLGTDLSGLPDALDEVVSKWTKGFDESMLLQGMEASTLSVSLPNPSDFFNVAIQEVAASWPIPQKVLVGMQTGERASTEDAREWAQTNMSRREFLVIPNIMDIVRRFEAWGIIPEMDWFLSWGNLTAPTIEEKASLADKMASVNQRMFATGDVVFTDNELREVMGYDPFDEGDLSEPIEDEDGEIEEDEV